MATVGGNKALTPRTQADSGRLACVSKCATCASAWTPVSVRPAHTVLILLSATWLNACSRTSCTVLPCG
jgi:hypothetical protein